MYVVKGTEAENEAAEELIFMVMSFEVGAAHDLWLSAQHPLFNFVFRTYHADIDVSATTVYEARLSQPAVAADAAMMIA